LGNSEFDISGIPLCPLNKEQLKSEDSCGGKNRSVHYKFTYPKSYRDKKGKCYNTCENPCIDNKSGRMTYVYPDKDFRLYLGIQINSDEWITVILAHSLNNPRYIKSIRKLLVIAV